MKQIILPEWLMTISYNGSVIPNGNEHNLVQTGSNCQVFAYQILRINGLIVPDYRSSELWADTEYSIEVQDQFEPLDVLFFHKKEEAYGAHIGVFLGENQVIHLSKSIGKPVIWELEAFQKDPKYAYLLGGKRFRKG